MKLFKDKDLKQELTNTLDLGTVLAGETKEYIYYVLNNTDSELTDLKFKIEKEEVQVVEFPKELKKNEVGTLKIKWTPSITIKSGLQTIIKIDGFEIWG